MTSVVMARSRASAIPSNAARSRPPCVLVADDDEDIRDLVAMSLRAAGYSVVTAADGAEALRVIGEENPDAAILDVMMPLVSGFQICQQMREDPATHGLPVIFLTAKADLDSISAGLEYGADAYFAKPVVLRHLVSEVGSLL